MRTSRKIFTKELLEPIIKESFSVSEVVRKLGYRGETSYYRTMVNQLCVKYGIDKSHFTGKAWCKGKTRDDDPRIWKLPLSGPLSDSEVFAINTLAKNAKVRYRRERKSSWVCDVCGIKDWMGKHLSLHVDHINGVATDNRKENLRLICPNCHQQTPTWGNGSQRQPPKVKKLTKTDLYPNWRHEPRPNTRKVERPPIEQVKQEVEELGYCAVGRKYGVSDNAIRKWLK